MREDDDNMVWRDYGDFTYGELSGAKVEYEIYDGENWYQGFGELVVYQNPEGLMHVEVVGDPVPSGLFEHYKPGSGASFCLSRHESPELAAFHLISNV